MSKNEYLNVGIIRKIKTKEKENKLDKNGQEMFELQLDNLALSKLLEIIKDHGKEFLKGLSDEDIAAGQKLKYNDPHRIPRITFLCTKPTPGREDLEWIHLNVSKKLDD